MPSASADHGARPPGTLYVVATPIGNLGDLSARAADTLHKVDRILAEDTRRTRGLLSHLGVTGKRVERFDAHAGELEIEASIGALREGQNLALVTDAGVPGVSDPGAALLAAAAAAGVSVVPIPGPSAVTTLISVSGFVEGPFLFLGFLPRRGKKRESVISRIVLATEPVVLFESPERLQATLEELAGHAPERHALVGRELTKLHEELVRGRLAELAALSREWRGEITLIVDASEGEAPVEPDEASLDAEIDARLDAGQLSREISEALSERFGIARRKLYERVQARKAARRHDLESG